MSEFPTEYDGRHIGTIRERVQAGLTYLHDEPQTDPARIDLDTLDLGFGSNCALGQAYRHGDYSTARDELGLTDYDVRRYGFHATGRFNDAEWAALEAEWRRQLQAERTEEPTGWRRFVPRRFR